MKDYDGMNFFMLVILTKQDVTINIRKYHYTFLLMLPWLLTILRCQLLLMSSRHSCSPVALFEAPMEKYCPQNFMDIKVNTFLLFTAYMVSPQQKLRQNMPKPILRNGVVMGVLYANGHPEMHFAALKHTPRMHAHILYWKSVTF